MATFGPCAKKHHDFQISLRVVRALRGHSASLAACPRHAELVQGNNRKVDRGQGQATITQYVCESCGTAWEYENNKANLHAGWSVVNR